MTSGEAQSPPKLFNMDAVETNTHTHEKQTQPHAETYMCALANTLVSFFSFRPKDDARLVFCSR